uniref:Uncharacterized protein n=1 Tax=Medicago truncatula TaxID=3880 RepID=I3S259_MEDTR|nr:unknown [Medicago truncatula]
MKIRELVSCRLCTSIL